MSSGSLAAFTARAFLPTVAFGAVAFGALSIACGGPGGSSGGSNGSGADASSPIPPSGPIPESLGPAAVAQAICQKVQQCGCVFAQSAPCTQDGVCQASTCVADFTNRYQSADSAAKSTGRVYDPQGARQCVDAITSADCLDVDYVNLCTVMWNGTQSIGQACSDTLACQTSDAAPAECGADGGCVPIPASSYPGEAIGAACSGTCTGNTCFVLVGGSASGGQCQHDAGQACIGGTCKALLAPGAACTGAYTCADPLSCIGGVCATRLADGSSCTPTGEDNPCVAGSGCVGSVCKTLKPNGQSCASDYECLENRCSSGGVCIGAYAQPLCGG